MKRRDFIKLSIAATGSLMVPSFLRATDSTTFDDYKAIIMISLNGGNDGVNTFIPSGKDNGECGYDTYAASRSGLAVANIDLTSKLTSTIQDDGELLLPTGDSNIYISSSTRVDDYIKSGFYIHDKGYSGDLNFGGNIATHSFMPEIAHLVNQGKVAVIQNVGNLIEPTTKESINDGKANLPLFLMAHDHQGRITETANCTDLNEMGIFGRLADAWDGINGDSIYGMNLSLTGNGPVALYGYKTNPTILSREGIRKMVTALQDWRYSQLYAITDYERDNPYKSYFNKLHRHSIDLVRTVSDEWNTYDSIYEGIKDAYGNDINPKVKTADDIAGFAETGVGDWEAYPLNAAKLIKIGIDKGLKRQVFYMSLSFAGFDTHAEQSRVHGANLRRISLAIDKLQRVLKTHGLEDKVVTIFTSEFGRSVGANGDGSDHAWGTNLWVVGGSVKGGLYGKAPSMKLGSDDDMNNKGRLIPTTSMSQYYATVLKWFGADSTLINTLLPELKNFEVQDLGFMG